MAFLGGGCLNSQTAAISLLQKSVADDTYSTPETLYHAVGAAWGTLNQRKARLLLDG